MNPDKLLDMAYPEGYQGGTMATRFIEPCAKLGYYLYPINGDTAHLVQQAHLQLANGHPVIFTEPDPYSSNPGDSHVCVFYADGSTNGQQYLISMDPFPLPGTNTGHPVHRFDSEWEKQLLFNQIWILEKLPPEEETVIIDLSTPGVSTYFQAVPGNDSQWKCKQTGAILQYGVLNWYRKVGNDALNGLTLAGLPQHNEIPIEVLGKEAGYPFKKYAGKGIVVVPFERLVAVYDPGHLYDRPPESGPVYTLQLYNGGAGTDPALFKTQALLQSLQAELAQLKAQPSASITADMQQIKVIAGKY